MIAHSNRSVNLARPGRGQRSKSTSGRKPRYINPYKMFYGAFVPNWLMQRKELSPGSKLLYGRLSQYAGEDGHCYPGQALLAQELGVSVRQIYTYTQELILHKLIEKCKIGYAKTYRY